MLAALALAVSCKKETGPGYTPTPKLAIVSAELEFMPGAATGEVVVDTQSPITATSDRDWCVPSVSGNKVSVSVAENIGKQSRYALLKLKTADAALDLTVIQYGEVLAGLSTLSDITATKDGDVLRVPIKVNVSVTVSPSEPWIHAEVTEKELIITVDPNTEPRTRVGTVSYEAGSAEGSFEVTQLPELKRPQDWILTEGETSFAYPKFSATVSLTAGGDDLYQLFLVAKSQVEEEAALENWIFDKLAPEARRSILDKMEETPGTEFKDYLLSGDASASIDDISVGPNYMIAVGFGENGYVSGLYQYKEVTIEDIRPTYFKWSGKWKLTGKALDKSNYEEVFEIMVDESDVDEEGQLKQTRLIARGLCSKNQAAEGVTPESGIGDMLLSFDKETGEITFYGQTGKKTFTSSKGSGSQLQLLSMYVKSGSTSYSNVTGAKFMRLAMKEDGSTAITALERSTGLPYKAFRIRLYYGGSGYTLAGDAGTIMIDDNLSITRVQ